MDNRPPRLATPLLAALVGLLAIVSPATGQKKKSIEDVRTMLRSKSPAERAHGAAIAAKYKMKDATAGLLDVIKSTSPGKPEEWFAADAAFDALIRSDATVFAPADGAKLAVLPVRFLHPVIILLARTPGRHQNALTKAVDRAGLERDPTAVPTIAASCFTLAEMKTPGLSTFVCNRLFDRSVNVWITQGNQKAPERPEAEPLPPRKPRPVPAGFPAIGYYRLGPQKGKKHLVARGEPNIGYVRVIAKAGQPPTFAPSRGPAMVADDIAIATLARLLDMKTRRLSALLPRRAEIRYRDDDALDRELKAIEARARVGFDKLFALLAKHKYLRPDQAAQFSKPEIVRHDLRAKQ
jgi:hypothetical protein